MSLIALGRVATRQACRVALQPPPPSLLPLLPAACCLPPMDGNLLLSEHVAPS